MHPRPLREQIKKEKKERTSHSVCVRVCFSSSFFSPVAYICVLCTTFVFSLLIDRPFIVLAETKPSKRHIPVWARYSPLRTRVEAHANTFSP